MTLSPPLRKLALTLHISVSVGWLGAIACFIALALCCLGRTDSATARAAYLAMSTIGWRVVAPLSVASLLSGLALSLGTIWGLFRHYWVVFKLAINLLALPVLWMFLRSLDAAVASLSAMPTDIGSLKNPAPLIHSTLALLLILAATILSVYKPRGLTPHGWRKQQDHSNIAPTTPPRSLTAS